MRSFGFSTVDTWVNVNYIFYCLPIHLQVKHLRQPRAQCCKNTVFFSLVKGLLILSSAWTSYHISIMEAGELAITYSFTNSQKGALKLVDSLGYSYNKRFINKRGDTHWQCVVRRKTMKCYATVFQRGEEYIRGKKAHCHPAHPLTACHKRRRKQRDLVNPYTGHIEQQDDIPNTGDQEETSQQRHVSRYVCVKMNHYHSYLLNE